MSSIFCIRILITKNVCLVKYYIFNNICLIYVRQLLINYYNSYNMIWFLVETKINEVENDQNSILSADDSSSGYESFKAMKDIDKYCLKF